jgi:hypothetical protein
VLWDDSVDGPIPQEGFVLGGMVREGDALAFSAERKAAHDAALAAVAAAQVAATEQARIEWGARMGLSETQTARLFALVN